ncbi:MAG: hypothetical protein CUN57_01150, partial [Phototrophicales bacterium]
VEVLSDGTGLRQVYANQALADVSNVTNGFEIKYYARSKVGTKSDGFYTFTGSPFVTYRFENPNPSTNTQVLITKTITENGNTKKWLTKLVTSATAWNLDDWYEDKSVPIILRKDYRTISNNGLDEEITVKDNANVVATAIKNFYVDRPSWGGKQLDLRRSGYSTVTSDDYPNIDTDY